MPHRIISPDKGEQLPWDKAQSFEIIKPHFTARVDVLASNETYFRLTVNLNELPDFMVWCEDIAGEPGLSYEAANLIAYRVVTGEIKIPNA